MAKLYFRYGTVNCGKSMEILKVVHNYEEQGKKVILMTSGLDDRTAVGVVASRIGISREAIPIHPSDSVWHTLEDLLQEDLHVSCILIDESQFLSREQVEELSAIVDELEIPVICFGLKNDFQNNLFEGAEALLLFADKLETVKTTCFYCEKKATMNLRRINGKAIYEGEQVQIGGTDTYVATCREHYYEPEE